MMKEQINISTSQVFSANEESPLNILYNDFAESPERNNLDIFTFRLSIFGPLKIWLLFAVNLFVGNIALR